MNRLIELKKSD